MQKDQFLDEVRHHLHLIFLGIAEQHRPEPLEKARLEGFMRAGVFLGVTSNTELQALMEEIHFEVFGETIAERALQRKGHPGPDQIDYGQYDSPAIERVSGR
jgi:hypothetical protein